MKRATPPESFVYFIQTGDHGPIKIGFSNDVRGRLQALQISTPERLYVRKIAAGGAALERDLHREFCKHRLSGEWFAPHAEVVARMHALPAAADNIEVIPFRHRAHKSPLHAWRLNAGMTLVQASKVIGICPALISNLENEVHTPGWATMQAIFEATDGAITPNDFANFMRQPRAAKITRRAA